MLSHRIVLGDLKADMFGCHGIGSHLLTVIEPLHIGHKGFDQKYPVVFQMIGNVTKTSHLIFLGLQPEKRIENNEY